MRLIQISAMSGPTMDEPESGEELEQHIPEISDEHDDSEARELTLEERIEKLKKRRWNVFMMLGLAIIMFTFALLPMPSPAPWEDEESLTDSVSPGQLNKQLAYIWGFPIQGEDFTDVTTIIDIELTNPPHEAAHLDVYLMEGHCDDLAARAEDYLNARNGDDADWTQHHERISSKPGSYEVEFAIDPGSYCLTMEYVDNNDAVISANEASINANAYFYSNSVIAGALGFFCLIMSAFAFIGAQKDGKVVKQIQEPDAEMTPEQKVLSETSIARITAGPAGPPGSPSASGPTGPPQDVSGPTGPPQDVSGPTGPPQVVAEETEIPLSVAEPSPVPNVEETSASEPTVASEEFHPAEGGYFFRVLPDGSYDQTPWFQDEEGNYHPYTGPAE